MNRGLMIVMIFATFFAGDRFGGSVLEDILYRSRQRFPSLYEGRFESDIVCIGNSRGVYALDLRMVEERTGMRAVNISHNAMTPRVAQAIFADYLAHNPKPKLLVVEVSFMTSRTTPSIVLDYKPFWNRSHRLQELAEDFSYKSVVASRWFHLYRYNSEIFLRALSYWLSGKSDQGGFMNKNITPALVAETEQLEPFQLLAKPEEFEALKSMIRSAQEAGIVVRPIVAPYLPSYAERIANLDSLLADFTQSTGLDVLDFSQSVQQTDRFADRLHINRRGTQAFTESLVQLGVFDMK